MSVTASIVRCWPTWRALRNGVPATRRAGSSFPSRCASRPAGSAPKAAVVKRVSGARDIPLSGEAANWAGQLRAATGVSVVDATVGQAAESAAKPVVILSSDIDDMRKLAQRIHCESEIQRVRTNTAADIHA